MSIIEKHQSSPSQWFSRIRLVKGELRNIDSDVSVLCLARPSNGVRHGLLQSGQQSICDEAPDRFPVPEASEWPTASGWPSSSHDIDELDVRLESRVFSAPLPSRIFAPKPRRIPIEPTTAVTKGKHLTDRTDCMLPRGGRFSGLPHVPELRQRPYLLRSIADS